MPRYKRIVIKLSGAAIAGESSFGFDQDALEHICTEVLAVRDLGIEVGIVVGGGNIFRGNVAEHWNINRVEADNMGMLATIINSVLLRAALKSKSDYDVRVMSALPAEAVAEPFIHQKAMRHLKQGRIVIFGGGIGQPYVTTDYPAVQRALQTESDAILVAKHGVDGVYTCDPNTNKEARRYRTLSYDEFVQRDLRIMDQSALLLARDHKLPVHIFNFDQKGCIQRICLGEDIGTSLTSTAQTALAD
ncbi:MAG: uridylate kinase [Bradymonadia bacterium]|jgi:uridylate kinase